MKTSKPDIVSLDRFIDGEDCLYYISELRANGYPGPIVVISVIDDEKAAKDAGADTFLAKPVPPFRLESTFRELAGGSLSRLSCWRTTMKSRDICSARHLPRSATKLSRLETGARLWRSLRASLSTESSWISSCRILPASKCSVR